MGKPELNVTYLIVQQENMKRPTLRTPNAKVTDQKREEASKQQRTASPAKK